MADPQPTPPTSGASLPPWRMTPRTPSPAQPVPAPTAIPGPWSRPTGAPPTASPPPPPATPRTAVVSSEPKDWGPIKPIRPVPKPTEEKVAYVLAQTERVVPDEPDSRQKRWIILGSIAGIVVVVGGTLAFIFFGRNEGPTLLANQAVILVNTNKAKNTNSLVNAVFPQPNANAGTNSNVAALDTDGDGLSDAEEATYGTSLTNPDTDGDGYADGAEVQNGYNPAGSGKL